MIEKELLVMCCVCKKIRIDDENDLWLSREDNPVLYDKLINRFDERISHTYCPEDYEIVMEEIRGRK